MTQWFYERNDYLLNHEVNKNFEEILWMTDNEFSDWLRELRKAVVYAWDELGVPPVTGRTYDDMCDMMKELEGFPVHEMWRDGDIIRNTNTQYSSIINSFFPTMMKTKITYSTKNDAQSIYDWFSKEELFDRQIKYARRHFKKDSFYHYSVPIKQSKIVDIAGQKFKYSSGKEFIKFWDKNPIDSYDYWLQAKDDDKEYTGYNEDLKGVKYLTISRKDEEWKLIPDRCKTNTLDDIDTYQIRIFKKGQKLFPLGFKAFRVSYCQYAVQFPPLTAKLLYEEFTKHCRDQDVINIWDPSSGWAGRILGAMSVKDDRQIHYIGTDPNTDHNTTPGRTKYHEVADLYNEVRNGGRLIDHVNTYEIFQCGSEVMSKQKGFQKYNGKLDMVFTSPPYFAKEVYSDDEAQSCHKFDSYELWRDGFLKPTLETAYTWLKPNRYLLWNIADVKFGKDILPLEQDSIDICKELGFEYIKTIKMTLAQMPGGNRTDDEGNGTAKNTVNVDGLLLKFEYIFVFKKP